MTATSLAVAASDVRDAAALISRAIVRTPLLEFEQLNDRAGTRVLVKFEGVQYTGSFKFRGAYNRLAHIPPERRGVGVVAWSSGNHAQGVAAAARRLGMPAAIVMPSDAPAIKLANTRRFGAEVITYDRYKESREEIARDIARQRGAVLVPSFDDPLIIAGQGTVGLEILEQAEDVGAELGQVLVPCGGGGLVAGVAIAIKDLAPSVDVFSVEPEAFDDTARSLRSGAWETVPGEARSICDALLAPSPGELTFPINKALLSGGVAVADEDVEIAVRFAFETLKLVVEPGGAVALAAVLAGKSPDQRAATAVIISGGNVDASDYATMISHGL